MKKSFTASLLSCTFLSVCGQFLYPVDPNPPNNPLTFTCHECNEETDGNCGSAQTDSSPTKECRGIQIGCWVTLNMDKNTYIRGCEQPESLRQGVFCNRHMEDKEFCYYEVTDDGLERICAKCCLNDYCNDDLLEGSPDPRFQTCIECDGRNEKECNVGGRDIFPNHMEEQCLMPNSDCWTGKTLYNGETFYTRGCQISACDDENVSEICTESQNRTTCLKCCSGGNKCNYGLLSGGSFRAYAHWNVQVLSSSLAMLIVASTFR